MNEENLRKYHAHLEENKSRKINFYYAKKDYFLSRFLSEWQSQKESQKTNELNNLIFKGGTLLSRNYLEYHRISEDLDFTHCDCLTIRQLQSKKERELEIKSRIKRIINEIKLISNNLGFEFETDRTNKKFIIMKNSRNIYMLKIYYGKELSDYIKFEINFVEDLINNPNELKINNLNDVLNLDKLYLETLGHKLTNLQISSYPKEEIILEKFRATLTRESIKERDLFDLYLINKNKNIFCTDNKLILRKIVSGNFTMKESESNFLSKKDLIMKSSWGDIEEDVELMSLINFDRKDFNKFKEKLLIKLKEIYE